MTEKELKQLKFAYISGGRAFYYCPFHNDKHSPNLCITLNGKYAGRWKCWACGKYGILDSDQNIIKLNKDKIYNPYIINWRNLQECYISKLNEQPLIKVAFANQLNVSMDKLDSFIIGYDGSAITIPMYQEYAFITGIQKQYQDRTKRNVRGSYLGMFVSPTINYWSETTIFLCEGFSDTVAVHDLGFNSIGTPCCNFSIKTVGDIIDGFFEFDDKDGFNIIIIPDNNKESFDYSKKLDRKLRIATGIFYYKNAKDIRQYIAKVGKQQVKQELEKCII